jgi:hypothetical protein
MRLVSDQPHRENITQRRGDQMRILADEQFEPRREIFICGLVIHQLIDLSNLPLVRLPVQLPPVFRRAELPAPRD